MPSSNSISEILSVGPGGLVFISVLVALLPTACTSGAVTTEAKDTETEVSSEATGMDVEQSNDIGEPHTDADAARETGSLRVNLSTSSEGGDPASYTVHVDNSLSKSVSPNGSVVFQGLQAGEHSTELTGLPANCRVSDDNERTISIQPNRKAETTYRVTCAQNADREATLWEYEQWTLENSSYSGNPFDLRASVDFEHIQTGKTHTTEMFYDGDNTWKFRFTGTMTGRWRYETTSTDPELDGKTGTIRVEKNRDADIVGFLRRPPGGGNKYAIQVGSGEVAGFLLNNYQIDDDGPYKHTHITAFRGETKRRVRKYVNHADKRGFTSVYVMLNNNLLEMGAYGHDQTSSQNPSLRAFRILDKIVETAHAERMRVYFWRWGDEARKWTPKGLEGGINGKVDRRVTRYFAARLGPLPGWSMGYGFDLHEWVNKPQIKTWFEDFQRWLGWRHLLSARSANLDQAHGEVNGYAQGDTEIGDYFTDTFPSYQTLVDELEDDTGAPHLLEERNVLGRWGVGPDKTRQLMWRTAMAGGMGGWYGHFNSNPVFSDDDGYPNVDQLKTHGRFWENRFRLDFERANDLTDAKGLAGDGSKHFVFYATNTSSIQIDISNASRSLPAIAVDAKASYREVDAEKHTINLPSRSDWAIAVGDFRD